MEMQDRLSAIRQTTVEDLKELEAIHCFLNLHDSANLDMLQRLHKEISAASSQADLETFSSNIRSQIEKTRQHFDIYGPREILLKYLDHAMAVTPPGDVFFMRKHSLSQLTSAYDSFVSLPLHAWIAIDVHGTHDLKPPKVLYRLLEEAQYRDMCVLFNMATTMQAASEQNDQAILAKSAMALHRATINAACHFIEAYINGIAHAHLLKFDGKLDPKTKAALTEWDLSQNRPSYQTL